MADDVQIGLDIDLDGSHVVVLTRQVNRGAKKRHVLLAMRKTRILIKYFMPHGGHANRMPILRLCLPGLLRTSVPSPTMYYLKNKISQLLEAATYFSNRVLILYCCSISCYSVTMETGRGGILHSMPLRRSYVRCWSRVCFIIDSVPFAVKWASS